MKTVLSVALLLLLFATGVSQRKQPPALAALIEAERAFARASVERGTRDSFLLFFADDGINFQPHPVKTREAILKRPAPASPPSVVLDWQPAYADISRGGDLGYTTGPYTLTDKSPEKKPTQYGFYFSIWKKQPDGAWKVVLDCGIDTPDHSAKKFGLKSAAPGRSPHYLAKIGPGTLRALLVEQDRRLLKDSQYLGLANGFLNHLGTEARLHRNGDFPIIGRGPIVTFLLTKNADLTWEPIRSEASHSGDFGYTYGSYELRSSQANDVEKGYYVRVWKRDIRGDWKLMLDTLSPIPPESK